MMRCFSALNVSGGDDVTERCRFLTALRVHYVNAVSIYNLDRSAAWLCYIFSQLALQVSHRRTAEYLADESQTLLSSGYDP